MLNKTPFFVIVSEGRWDAVGAPNAINRYKTWLIKREGGISDTVPYGTYEFKITWKWFRFYTELTPSV